MKSCNSSYLKVSLSRVRLSVAIHFRSSVSFEAANFTDNFLFVRMDLKVNSQLHVSTKSLATDLTNMISFPQMFRLLKDTKHQTGHFS